MGQRIYGVLDSDDCLIDISRNEAATKRYATINGYTKVGYRVGYNAFISAEKFNNKWANL